jgi:hypothetical protein
MEFKHFKLAVAAQFERMQKHTLYRVDNLPDPEGTPEDQKQKSLKDQLWATYLASFPEGTNPHYRERTEHDCSCCRQFIRAVGDAVAIIDGKIVSLWDVAVPQEPGYEVVAKALSALVKSKPITDVFFHYEGHAGTDKNFEQMVTGVKTWDHFHVNIKRDYVRAGKDIPSLLNGPRTSKQTFLRALTEIDLDSIQAVSDLIATNSLYRGGDYKFQVTEFLKEKKKFDKLATDADREIFAWQGAKSLHGAVCGIGNSGIGAMLYKLAEGADFEGAIKFFEHSIGCPSNFKRPTALVSKQMLEKAKKTIDELGLMSALQRRYATLSDISINNVLFASNDTKKVLSGNVFDELAASATTKVTKSLDKIEEISIDKFLSDVLPRAEGLELLVENRHTPNFVSLIAPNDPTANPLFQWPNGFSWSYSGEFADAIKERVKAQGGNVTGDVCCRLAWDYTDDLDFHMHEPDGGHIHFPNKRRLSDCGGMLDVDANGGDGQMEHPVENIFYESKRRMKVGTYSLRVNNWSRRSDGVGFEVEIEIEGMKHNFVYDKVLGASKTIEVAKIEYKKDGTFEVKGAMPSTQSSKQVWGLSTQSFVPVNAVMLSPNFWDAVEIPGGHGTTGVGNLHYFFMLDGCKNDGTARGFFNEFLKSELSVHRKALEMVGGKLKVADSDNQLSGLGFSVTARNNVVVRVKGSFTRQLKIVF